MKRNINIRLQAFFIFSLTIVLSFNAVGQTNPDPFVNSATVAIAPTAYGETANSISFVFLNVSPIGVLVPPTPPALPVTVDLQLSKMKVLGTFTPLNVTGVASGLFTWTYDSTLNIITGTLKNSVPPFLGGLINITGFIVTDSATIASPLIGFSATVNAAPAINASATNDFTSSYTYSQGSPLPVEWLGFNAKRYGQNAHLIWTTAKESNVSHFTPQFSLNGLDFEDLTDVNPKNGASINEYLHIHDIGDYMLNAIVNPVLYYRVKQYDLDQQFTLTSVKKINLTSVTEDGFAVYCYPNPATDFLHVSIDGIDLEDAVFYKLLDLQGRIVFEQKNVTMVETDNIAIPLSAIARGSYMLKINNGEFEYSNKILLK